MKIKEILKDSPAERNGLKSGDIILSLNGEKIRDEIDLRFYSAEEVLEVEIKRGRRIFSRKILKELDSDLGIRPEGIRIRRCSNRCLFCFVDQMPSGLRPSLYIKDEDFRLSFLHGNYLTLTNISRQDLARIYQQRLSPLYISVHATDDRVRRFLLGNQKASALMPLLRDLISHGISLHTQIVLCPGINDGRVLDRTIEDLICLYPGVVSIAIVPVGLTRHRGQLYPLKSISKTQAKHLIERYRAKQVFLRKRFKRTILYFSDELYLLSGLDMRSDIWYDDYPQLENGVGMVSSFLSKLKYFSLSLPPNIRGDKKILLITGLLAKPILEQLRSILNKIKGIDAEIVAVKNDLFGSMVTVSGLLSARDILNKLKIYKGFDLVALPDNLLNRDGIFIDGLSRKEFEKKVAPVRAVFGLDELAQVISSWTG